LTESTGWARAAEQMLVMLTMAPKLSLGLVLRYHRGCVIYVDNIQCIYIYTYTYIYNVICICVYTVDILDLVKLIWYFPMCFGWFLSNSKILFWMLCKWATNGKMNGDSTIPMAN
jgi:hypothetical protein